MSNMMISVLGDNFMKYMEAFKPCLIVSLKNSEEYSVRFPLFFIPAPYIMLISCI